MAKASKPKKEEPLIEEQVKDIIKEDYKEQADGNQWLIPISPKEIQPEIEFLTELLATQVDGKWHGPAAGLIRDRIKLLNS